MATVDFFTGFTYKWAQTGNTFAWDDAQYKLGWATVGDTPPTVEQFNRVHQIADEKSNWLYGQLKTVADAKSVALSAGSLTGLQQVLAAYGQSSTTDTTAGRWMRVGAFGLGLYGPSHADYGYPTNFDLMDGMTSWVSISGSFTNGPAGAASLPYVGVLSVSVRNGSGTMSIKQEYSGHPSSVNGPGTWVRYGSGNLGARTWAAWEEVYTSRSIPAASSTVSGIVELATVAETTTGTDATRAISPAGLKGALPGIIPHGESIITATGNWVSPIAGYIDVQVWAGGGGGGGIGSTGGVGGGGGGGGGYARWRGTVTLGQTISCTVGALGSGGGAGAGGGVGGNSAFGAFATATGGSGGASNASGNGGTGGLGSAGTITTGGADGNASSTALGGPGGSASFGGAGGGAGVGPSGPGMRPGGGGGGRGPSTVGSGANGGAGLIIVTW